MDRDEIKSILGRVILLINDLQKENEALKKERDELKEKLALSEYDKEAMNILGDERIRKVMKERDLWKNEALAYEYWENRPDGLDDAQAFKRMTEAREARKRELKE